MWCVLQDQGAASSCRILWEEAGQTGRHIFPIKGQMLNTVSVWAVASVPAPPCSGRSPKQPWTIVNTWLWPRANKTIKTGSSSSSPGPLRVGGTSCPCPRGPISRWDSGLGAGNTSGTTVHVLFQTHLCLCDSPAPDKAKGIKNMKILQYKYKF